MAINKSSRPRPHRARSTTSSLVASSRRGGRVAGVSAAACRPICSVAGLRRLSALARQLETIYAIAVAAEGALRHQAAEQDAEVADCLRVGVCDPIADQIQALREIAEHRKN